MIEVYKLILVTEKQGVVPQDRVFFILNLLLFISFELPSLVFSRSFFPHLLYGLVWLLNFKDEVVAEYLQPENSLFCSNIDLLNLYLDWLLVFVLESGYFLRDLWLDGFFSKMGDNPSSPCRMLGAVGLSNSLRPKRKARLWQDLGLGKSKDSTQTVLEKLVRFDFFRRFEIWLLFYLK